MTKCKKVLATMMVVVSVLMNCMVVSAAEVEYCDSCGARLPVYSRDFRYREMTGQHTVDVNGRQAICFIYTEYFEVRYYCSDCKRYEVTTEVVEDVHSLGK